MSSYADWTEHHATMFALQGENDPAMLYAWTKAFAARGYTPDELFEATEHLATAAGKVPMTRPQHLDSISSRVRERRLYQLRHEDEQSQGHEWGTHVTCSGTGWVIVPHPRLMRDGIWRDPYYTATVVCNCPLGNRRRNSHAKREHQQLTLEAYEQTYPQWISQVAMRDAAKRDMRSAVLAAASAEKDVMAKRLRLSVKDFAD